MGVANLFCCFVILVLYFELIAINFYMAELFSVPINMEALNLKKQNNLKMTSLNENDTNSAYDVFLSYQWDIQESILKLYDQLTRVHGLKVWMDMYDMGTGDLNESKQFHRFITVVLLTACV